MNEFTLQIEPIGVQEYTISITLESVHVQDVIGAGNAITKNMISLTASEYQDLVDNELIDSNTLYLITT